MPPANKYFGREKCKDENHLTAHAFPCALHAASEPAGKGECSLDKSEVPKVLLTTSANLMIVACSLKAGMMPWRASGAVGHSESAGCGPRARCLAFFNCTLASSIAR